MSAPRWLFSARSGVPIAIGLFILGGLWLAADRDPLVVYCAHDSIEAESVLRVFESQSGIPLSIRYDSEATKSLGLVELLVAEKDTPRCDVFWNGEMLGTTELAEQGILEPYRSKNAARIPAQFRDPDDRWIGFAARLRVWIFNTAHLPPAAAAATIASRFRSGDLSRVAIAKPLYGTTFTHFVTWWEAWGAAALQRWRGETQRAGLRELNGNAAVKDAVAAGVCDFGLTDTDDFFSARDAGQPVAMLPVWLDDGTTLCIPNTVAIIRGTRHRAAAEKLVDFLSSADGELALAHSGARQIPLGPVPAATLPADFAELREWASHGHDLRSLAAARAACLSWLKKEQLR